MKVKHFIQMLVVLLRHGANLQSELSGYQLLTAWNRSAGCTTRSRTAQEGSHSLAMKSTGD